jgi:hypothetical protein
LLLLFGRFFSRSSFFFFASTYATDGKVVRGKNEDRRERLSSTKKENDVSWTFAHTYVLLKKKAFASLFARPSLVFLALFIPVFSHSLVFAVLRY